MFLIGHCYGVQVTGGFFIERLKRASKAYDGGCLRNCAKTEFAARSWTIHESSEP